MTSTLLATVCVIQTGTVHQTAPSTAEFVTIDVYPTMAAQAQAMSTATTVPITHIERMSLVVVFVTKGGQVKVVRHGEESVILDVSLAVRVHLIRIVRSVWLMPSNMTVLVSACMAGITSKTAVSIMNCVLEPVIAVTDLSQMNVTNAQNMPKEIMMVYASAKSTGMEIAALSSIKTNVKLPVHHAMVLACMTALTVSTMPIVTIKDHVYAIATGEKKTAPSTVDSVIYVVQWDVVVQQTCTATHVSIMHLLLINTVSVMQDGPVMTVASGRVSAMIGARVV